MRKECLIMGTVAIGVTIISCLIMKNLHNHNFHLPAHIENHEGLSIAELNHLVGDEVVFIVTRSGDEATYDNIVDMWHTPPLPETGMIKYIARIVFPKFFNTTQFRHLCQEYSWVVIEIAKHDFANCTLFQIEKNYQLPY